MCKTGKHVANSVCIYKLIKSQVFSRNWITVVFFERKLIRLYIVVSGGELIDFSRQTSNWNWKLFISTLIPVFDRTNL